MSLPSRNGRTPLKAKTFTQNSEPGTQGPTEEEVSPGVLKQGPCWPAATPHPSFSFCSEVDPAQENTPRILAVAVFLLQPAKTSASIGDCEPLHLTQTTPRGIWAVRLYSSHPPPTRGPSCTFLPVLAVSAPSLLSPGDKGTPLKMRGCSQGLPCLCQGGRGHPAKLGGCTRPRYLHCLCPEAGGSSLK